MRGFFLSIDAIVALIIVLAALTALAGSHYAYALEDAKLADVRQPARDFLYEKYFANTSLRGTQFGLVETIPSSGDVRLRAMVLAYNPICGVNNWESTIALSVAQANQCLTRQENFSNTAHYAWVTK